MSSKHFGHDMTASDDWGIVKMGSQQVAGMTVRSFKKFLEGVDPDRVIVFAVAHPTLTGAFMMMGIVACAADEGTGHSQLVKLFEARSAKVHFDQKESEEPGIIKDAFDRE